MLSVLATVVSYSEKLELFWYFSQFFVILTSSKVLSLDNKNKKPFLFCIVLAYSYLCNCLAMMTE